MISSGTTHNRYYVHTNHQGSFIALTDSTGSVVQMYSYDSFGVPYIKSGSGISTAYTLVSSYTGSLHENSRLYTGREYDRETHLYFLRARYYSPSTGKFISRDPILQNDQINLYTYVMNNPLMYLDLDGMKASAAIAENGRGMFLNLLSSFRDHIRKDLPNSDSWSMRFSAKGADFILGDGLDLILDHDKMSGVQQVTKIGLMLPLGKALKGAKIGFNIGMDQVKKKFKHAINFGVDPTKSNPTNWNKFKDAITKHIKDGDTQVIQGTYRKENVTHYLNRNTNNNVIINSEGSFVSGWKLNNTQIKNLLQNGSLGGK